MSSQEVPNCLPLGQIGSPPSSSSHSTASPCTSPIPSSSSSSSSVPDSSFAPITTAGAILNIADSLIRSVQSHDDTRQIPLRCEKDPVFYRRNIIALCLEGTIPAPSASLQYLPFSLNSMPDFSLGSWEPHKNPLDSARMTLSEFRDQMLSPEERRVAKPAEIRKAMQGELADMRGIWTDVILNNFEREIVERPDDFEEGFDEEVAEEGKTTKEGEPSPNMSVCEESDDDEDYDEDGEEGDENKEDVANVVENAVEEIVKLEEAVEVEMVEIKRVTQVEIVEVKKGRVKTINMNKAGTDVDNRIAKKAPALPRRDSQCDSIQARLEQATDKMRRLASRKGDSVPDNVLSTRPVVLKVIGSKPPPQPRWVHASRLTAIGLEQYQNCNCGSSLEMCAGCQSGAVQGALEEVLIFTSCLFSQFRRPYIVKLDKITTFK